MTTSAQSRPRSSRTSARGPASQAWRASTLDPLKVLRRYKWLIVISGALGGALGIVAFMAFSRYYPLFQETAHFEVRPALRSSTEMSVMDISNDDLVFRLGKTETLFLTRHDVLDKALRDPEVRKTKWFQQFVAADGTPAPEKAVDELSKTIRAGVIRGTNYFTLSWRTHNPDDVPIVVNAVAETYMTRRGELAVAVYNDNLELFRSKLATTNRDMQDLTREISEIIQSRGITTLDDVRFHQEALAQEQSTSQLAEMSASLHMSLSALNQISSKLQGVLEPSPEDIRAAEQDSTVLTQRRVASELNAQLRHLIDKFSATHPEVRETQGRLRAIEQEVDEKVDQIVRTNLQANKRQLQNQVESFQQTIAKLDEEIVDRDKILRELAATQAEFEGLEQRRNHLEKRRESELELIKEAELMKLRADASRIQLVKRASTPRKKVFPRIEIIVPLFGLVAVALTTGLIFLRELTDQRVKSGSDLSVIPGAFVLGTIPELAEDPTKSTTAELVVREHPHSILAESYRQAMSRIVRQTEHTGYQTILLSSGLPGAGTTTVATNLAAAANAMGKSVILVDANLRRPGLAAAIGITGEPAGFGDVLCDGVTLDEAIQTISEDFAILPAGTRVNRRFERLADNRVETILGDLRARYDYVIVDAPPAVVAGDAMSLADRVDCAVVVVRASLEQRGLVARLINQFGDARCELLGVLLNRPRGTAGGYFKKNYETMASYHRD